MILDLEDVQIRARITGAPGDRVRLSLEYPRSDYYRDRIMTALADLLRPPQPPAADPSSTQEATPETGP